MTGQTKSDGTFRGFTAIPEIADCAFASDPVSEVIPDRVRAAVEAVVDEASFVAFLIVLAEDWQLEQEQERTHPTSPYSEGARGWQNGTVAAVLDAAAAWAGASSKGLPLSGYTPSANPWRRCADIIYMGKVYE